MTKKITVKANSGICSKCKHLFTIRRKLSKNREKYTVFSCALVKSKSKNIGISSGWVKIEKNKLVLPIEFKSCYNDLPEECAFYLEQVLANSEGKDNGGT